MINKEACIELVQRIVELDEDATTASLVAYADDPDNVEFFETLEGMCEGTNREKTDLVGKLLGLLYLGLVEIKEIK